MDTGEPQEKKKRGRKPKSEKGSKASDKSSTKGADNMDPHILHLNITQRMHLENSSSTDKLYEKDFCTYDPEIQVPNAYNEYDTFISQPYELVVNNEIPDTDREDRNVKIILQNIDKQTYTNVACYWCCHKFDHEYLGMPVKYKDNVFDIYGCFCSFECMCAYNFYSNESNHNTWEVYNLINIMAHKMDYSSTVYPAPPRKCLTFFGGYMSIDEFRKFRNTNKIINANKCPMVVMVDQIEEINDYYHNHNQHKHSKHIALKLDKARIKSFEKKLNVQLEDNIKKNFKNTLDATMMINS